MSRYPLAHTSGLNTSRWDRIVMVTTKRDLPLSSQSRLQHSPKKRHALLLVVVEDEDSRRLRHVVVAARDRRERARRQPSSREAYTACSPSPHPQSFIACAEMLSWCGKLVEYVVERSPMTYFARTLPKTQLVNSGFSTL